MYEKRRDILMTILPKIIRFSQVSIHLDYHYQNVIVYIATEFGHNIKIEYEYRDFLSVKPVTILCDILSQFRDKVIDCYIDKSVYSVASTYLANKEVVEDLSNA